ncbi:MAG: ABC transporter permease [Cyanobacteria bacterium HKST-UBA06]|nr:ABC transporter permease [Cyanobacteria bacterium HKST-UBA06]
MENLTTELRITGRIFREFVLGLKRTGWMNLLILITMASILSIFGVVMAVVLEMGVLLKQIGAELEISVYLKDQAHVESVERQIAQLPHTHKITFISKKKAWQDMQKDFPLPEIENPLPNTIHVQLDNVEHIPEIVEQLKAMPGVENVNYVKNVLDKVRGITKGASAVGVGLSIFLGMLTTFIISNTVHLLIENKNREIEILRMMGVGNWYIRLPFLIQGGFYGLLGSVFAYFPLSWALNWLNYFFSFFQFQTSGTTFVYVMSLLVVMSIVVGAGGAAFAVRKYLHI